MGSQSLWAVFSIHLSLSWVSQSPAWDTERIFGQRQQRGRDIWKPLRTFPQSPCFPDGLWEKTWAMAFQRIKQISVFGGKEDCFLAASLGASCWPGVLMLFSIFLCHNLFWGKNCSFNLIPFFFHQLLHRGKVDKKEVVSPQSRRTVTATL